MCMLFKMFMKKLHTAAELPCHLTPFSTHTHTYCNCMSTGVPHMAVCNDWMFWAITASPHLIHTGRIQLLLQRLQENYNAGTNTHTHTHTQ